MSVFDCVLETTRVISRSQETSRRTIATRDDSRLTKIETLPGTTLSTRSFAPGPATLFVAHPGHELCLHGWLECSRAEVFVLTDGSGGTGRSRLDSTTRVIEQCRGETGSIYGRFRDADGQYS